MLPFSPTCLGGGVVVVPLGTFLVGGVGFIQADVSVHA